MTPLLLLSVVQAALAAAPCVYWTQGLESRPTLDAAGITQVCVAPERADAWRAAGFAVTAVSDAQLAAREALPPPGITARAGLASPTRAPWVVANGWRFTRQPKGAYVYKVPAGKAALAAAEVFAYGSDTILDVDPADLAAFGAMLAFLKAVPAADLPALADLGVVDDGSPAMGEVLNLLTRRNLLFQLVQGPSPRLPLTIKVGDGGYSAQDVSDPSAFALKVRRQLTDERRTLRVYGSEVVIARVTGDGTRIRLHLLNYGGRDIEGLRVRLRGTYRETTAYVAGAGKVPLTDQSIADGVTEFSVPRLATYAVIDLK